MRVKAIHYHVWSSGYHRSVGACHTIEDAESLVESCKKDRSFPGSTTIIRHDGRARECDLPESVKPT